jgi:uncharacterized protein (DUF885 family)
VDGFVTWIDTAIANMRTGIGRGITQPRDIMTKVVPQLDTQIVPAYRRLRAFVHDEYLPRCRSTFGISDLAGGKALYAFAVRNGTTASLTADEIFALGEKEVARITAEISRLQAEIIAAGEAPPARYTSVNDLLRAYADFRASVDAALPALFRRFPKAGFEIRPIEAFRERSMPSSYVPASVDGVRPGVFYLNASPLSDGRPMGVSRSLFLHEAVPGHHLQLALQRENRRLPGFRRFSWYNAFGEGWALYAEGLGVELGAYGNRHDRLDMLWAELFRAKRLVVDVGLHAKGWTRAQAIEYLGAPRDNSEREVDRYLAWPGRRSATRSAS